MAVPNASGRLASLLCWAWEVDVEACGTVNLSQKATVVEMQDTDRIRPGRRRTKRWPNCCRKSRCAAGLGCLVD